MPNYMRAFCERVNAGKDGDPIRFVASTEDMARDELVVEAGGWQLANYRANPVVLWSHDYMGRTLPIGRADARVDGKVLVADITFDQQDEFARQIESKYRRGFLNAISVGWQTLEQSPPLGKERARVTKAELLDISAVPVPADPKALAERQARGLQDVGMALAKMLDGGDAPAGKRGAIPPHSTDKAPEDSAWDGAGEVAQAEGKEQLRRMHAWVDESMDPDLKQAYKLPHHLHTGEVVWRGAAAAMARLLQAGTQIPDGDRKGVYVHLERHYKQFDKQAPEFRTAEEIEVLGLEEIRGLFLEGEAEMVPAVFSAARAGAVLNTRNRERLEQARDLIAEVLASAEKPKEEIPGGRAMDDGGSKSVQANEALLRLQKIFEFKEG